MKRFLLTALMVTVALSKSYCQQYFTKTGFINFYSSMPLEDIKADNNQLYAVIDAGKKMMAFSLLMKGFLFARELQQEHFNENYVESDKYPKATFTGNYTEDISLTKNGIYPVTVKGNLSMHGVTKPIEVPATIEIKGGRLLGKCVFNISPEDYKIVIPSIVRDKIAKKVAVTVKIDCSPK